MVEYKEFLYQAASWKTARRVVAKVEHHAGELFPRVGIIVTNLTLPSRAVVQFYNKRGTSEQWIKEGKQAVKMTRPVFTRRCCKLVSDQLPSLCGSTNYRHRFPRLYAITLSHSRTSFDRNRWQLNRAAGW